MSSSTTIEEQMIPKKYRVLMVTGIYPTLEQPHKGTFVKPIVDALLADGHTVEIVHPNPKYPTFLRYLLAILQVFFKTLTGRFDIVHGHYGLWCLVARMQWTTPVVAAYLGDDLLGTVTEDGSLSKKSLLVVRISQWLCRHVEVVTVKSEQMKKAARTDDAIVLADGINFDLFQPMPRTEARSLLGWDQNKYYIVFANNPAIPVKNFKLAKAAIERLRERSMEAELMVATGLPQSKVVQYINASNALILPSIAEGAPNVVKEAMACNIPVVATNVGDVEQVISHTEGCAVCALDAEAMAEGLEKALLHTERTTGRADILQSDSMLTLKHILAMYEQAVHKKVRKSKKRNGEIMKQEVAHASTS